MSLAPPPPPTLTLSKKREASCSTTSGAPAASDENDQLRNLDAMVEKPLKWLIGSEGVRGELEVECE